jgi:hypothetical protein
MTDSLTLARLFELLGSTPSPLPQCAGAVFTLGKAYDLGAPQPVAELVMTLMGDGERPSGWRASNRTITLPVTIRVPATADAGADRLLLATAREVLLRAVYADEFTLVWALDGSGGLRNLVWDCFHAKAQTVVWDMLKDKQRVSELSVTFDALPYGRSDDYVSVTFDNPVAGRAAAPVPLTADDYSTVSTTTQATWWSQSPVTALFANSARWRHELTDGNSPLWYTRTGMTAMDLTGLDRLTLWFGLGTDAAGYRHWHQGHVSFTFTLTDSTGRILTFGQQVDCRASANPDWPRWNLVSAQIPQGKAFTYSSVTGYSVKAWNETHTWKGRNVVELDPTGYLSGLTAVPHASPKRPSSNRGATYVMYDMAGTAPAPINVHCQLVAPEQVPATQTLLLPGAPGTTNNYTAPAENPNWLSVNSAGFEASLGSWTGADGLATNATLAQSATFARTGTSSMRLTPVTGGTTMIAASCTAAQVASVGLACAAGDRVAVRAFVRGPVSRTVQVGAEFFNGAGASLGIVYGPAGADSTSAFTTYDGRVTAPASSAAARLVVQVQTPGAGEFHYVDDAYLAYAVQATVACLAAGGGGGSTSGYRNAGGGPGGGEIAWEVSLDLTAGAAHQYSIGKGGLPQSTGAAGLDGGDSWFQGTSVQVRGHGGKGGGNAFGDLGDGTAGLGGTGSVNGHHFNGGTGSAGDHTQWEGGGGGGAAGDGGAGAAGGTGGQHNPGAGGAAGALGIAGGAGAPGYGGQATGAGWGGDAAGGAQNYPGGGGAGSASDTRNHKGSAGANGLVRVTIKTFVSKSQFPALIVHKPSPRSGLIAPAIIPAGDAGDPPDGREYAISPVDGQNARYGPATYSVLPVAWSWNGTAARTVTVTIRQYESSGGASSSVSVSASVTPASVLNGIVNLGEVTLPVKEMPPDNTDSYFTIAVTSGNAADRFLDVLLLDTQGQTFWISMAGAGYSDYWIDEPAATNRLGRVLGSIGDRSQAVSVLGSTFASGGTLQLVPTDNIFTLYSPSGQPSLEADYLPHWHHERLT